MSDFLDMASMARKLGITEAVLRARILDRQVLPYAYVSNEHLEGDHEKFLPCWSHERYPFVRWNDNGSSIGDIYNVGSQERGKPGYVLSGWVVLSSHVVGELLADKRDVNLHDAYVGVEDRQSGKIVALRVIGKRVWIPEEEGGYHDSRGTQLSSSDIYLLPEEEASPTEVDPRRERSLLRVIRALDVMAKLPARGAATAVERQLQELGFQGPNDETVRRVLAEARTLEPDAKA